ncbi:MAG: uroporphyrinogen decarboxylase family protein [Lentisphaeria bacterium]|nr:uroporphyrinogen decarboxylase family protein [Lentisphaeria bacterium]
MQELSSIERISRQLKHLPVDRVGLMESFWNHTVKHWVEQGKMPAGESAGEHFGLDIGTCWAFNLKVDYKWVDQLVAEDEDTRTFLDGNGATLRRYKSHDTTPEHINYSIADRTAWEERAKPFLTVNRERINLDGYRSARQRCQEKQRFFCWGGVNVFEAIHPVVGHENMLLGMALDPDWVKDMADTFADLLIGLMEIMFAEAGKPDGIWFFDDMGFRGRPFMSPEMYRELIFPAHQKTIAYVHSQGLPVIMHSCGFVEPLLPGMIEAGIDCLQAIEVKAGMDLLRIYKQYGHKIALMGGIDVRPVANNDLPGIEREVMAKLPLVMGNNGFIFHSDHSIPESTDYETYQYFLNLGRSVGKYKD